MSNCQSDRMEPPKRSGVPVYKFGGTSVGTGARIRAAAELVAASPTHPVVVVSAMAGVTTLLERLAAGGRGEERATSERAALEQLRVLHREALDEVLTPGTPVDHPRRERMEDLLGSLSRLLEAGPAEALRVRFLDRVWAYGEDLSVELMAAALEARGLRATVVDAREVVRTDDSHGGALPRDQETYRRARERLGPLVREGIIPVLQGFIGATEEGVTTTLGRGGSDFTAAIVGAALDSETVTIWTDVDGIYSGDPATVPGARILPELGYEEAVELAYFGARVVHPAAAKHAVSREVSLRIRNSFRPAAEGTVIRHDRREGVGVAAVAHRTGVTLLRVRSRPYFMAHGFLAQVFDVLARHALPVDMVATSHTSTAFTVDLQAPLEAVTRELERVAEVEVVPSVATVSAVGRGMAERPGTAAAAFRALASHPIHLISRASDVTLSLVVPEASAGEAVRRLHEALVENAPNGRER